MTNAQRLNPETSAERRPLLDVERWRVAELSEGVQALVEAGRNEHGIGIVPDIDMAVYTNIDPNNAVYRETTPENVTELSQYAQSIARSSTEQQNDIPKAA